MQGKRWLFGLFPAEHRRAERGKSSLIRRASACEGRAAGVCAHGGLYTRQRRWANSRASEREMAWRHEKVAKLGLVRERGYIYFVGIHDGHVWRRAMRADGTDELISQCGVEFGPGIKNFLNAEGDVVRDVATEEDLAAEVLRERGVAELNGELLDSIDTRIWDWAIWLWSINDRFKKLHRSGFPPLLDGVIILHDYLRLVYNGGHGGLFDNAGARCIEAVPGALIAMGSADLASAYSKAWRAYDASRSDQTFQNRPDLRAYDEKVWECDRSIRNAMARNAVQQKARLLCEIEIAESLVTSTST